MTIVRVLRRLLSLALLSVSTLSLGFGTVMLFLALGSFFTHQGLEFWEEGLKACGGILVGTVAAVLSVVAWKKVKDAAGIQLLISLLANGFPAFVMLVFVGLESLKNVGGSARHNSVLCLLCMLIALGTGIVLTLNRLTRKES
jgi:hypothetical protein